jgi:hypothetical protein
MSVSLGSKDSTPERYGETVDDRRRTIQPSRVTERREDPEQRFDVQGASIRRGNLAIVRAPRRAATTQGPQGMDRDPDRHLRRR